MIVFIAILLFIMLFFIIYMLEKVQMNKKRDLWIFHMYGKIPEHSNKDNTLVALYWNYESHNISVDEQVDTITWNDLDMDSIYNRVNACTSFVGEQVLYQQLHLMPKEKTALKSLETYANFMEEHPSNRINCQRILYDVGKEESSYYLPPFITQIDSIDVSGIWLYKGLQGLLIVVAFLFIVTQSSLFLGLLLTTFSFNVALYALKKSQHELYLNTLGGMIRLIKATNLMVKELEGHLPFPDKLQEYRKELKPLSKMIHTLSNKKQATITGDVHGLLRDYLIGGTLWDFTSFYKIVTMLRGHRKAFMEVYHYLGWVDMTISLSSYRNSLPYYCTPVFTESSSIYMEEGYHPLINDPVSNTMDLYKNCTITGSNASGKSTFIKSVALQAILAQNLFTCTARSCLLPDLKVMTSMAIRDDLMVHDSYFMKEIKYLKRMIFGLDQQRLTLCIIDEILKGTNTAERIAASTAVLKYLTSKHCLTIVATHDLELVHNLGSDFDSYYFCEEVAKSQVTFDYKLRKGVSNTRNAIALLESMGFPTRIISDAKNAYKSM